MPSALGDSSQELALRCHAVGGQADGFTDPLQLGEIDVSVLLKQYAEEAVAKRLSPEWRGGAYYAVGRRGVKPPDSNSSAHVGLIYVSKWATDNAAQEFARIYASALPSRYNKVNPEPLTRNPLGWTKYVTSDGPIFIQQQGNIMVIVESLDDALAARIVEAAGKQVQEDSKSKTVAAGTAR